MPDSRRVFLLAVAATLAFRLWLAAVTPITGDEAYFIQWGRVPDWGFYDHPPMIGWWLAALLRLGDAEWLLRLPVVLLPVLLAFGSAWLLQAWHVERPWLGATLVALAPTNVWNVVITTDTPLVFFSFLSGLAFLRAARDDSLHWYAAAGLLLGLAFLSKYFAVLLGFAYLCHALWRPSQRKALGLAVLVTAALPAVAINLWWNWGHCWANVMFNLYNRHEGNYSGLSWTTPLLYAGMLLYLLTPPAVLLLWRRRARLRALGLEPRQRALACIALAPLAVFAALSLMKTIGLHWALSFLPFVLLMVVQLADGAALRRLVRFFGGFALVHVIAVVVVAQLPVETWNRTRLYDGIVLTVKSHELLEALQPYAAEFEFAADGYSPAVILSYNARRYFFVFGEGSSHARHDDILTDMRALEGRNILVLRKSAPDLARYQPYFRSVEQRDLVIRGARYYLVLGRGFGFARYREQVLEQVRSRYYAVPSWLPMGGCYFCERYFPERRCRR